MGEYCYTLRAKTITSPMFNGSREKINLFSYLSKPFYRGMFGSTVDAATRLGTARAIKTWEGRPMPKFVVLLNKEWISAKQMPFVADQLYPVYTDVQSAVWYDNGKFPGSLVGYIHVHSGKAHGFYTEAQHKEAYEEKAKTRKTA